MKLKRITAPLKQKAKEVVKRIKEMPFEPEPLFKKPGYIDLTKKKPIIELNKAFSVVIGQKSFAKGGVVLKRLRSTNNPHKIRVPRQTLPKKEIIDLAESTKPTKTYAKIVRALNKPKASILETLSKTTGLPSIEKKAAKARELTTKAGSSQAAVRKAGNVVSSAKKTKGLVEETIMDPGKMAVKATEEGIRRPILSTGTILGKFQLTSPNPVVQAFPTTPVAAGLETGVRRAIPSYDRLTTETANKFHGSKLRDLMERGINLGTKGLQIGIA